MNKNNNNNHGISCFKIEFRIFRHFLSEEKSETEEKSPQTMLIGQFTEEGGGRGATYFLLFDLQKIKIFIREIN